MWVDVLPLEAEKFGSVLKFPTHMTIRGWVGHVTSVQLQRL